ncbi:MAG: flavodoxin family protein [Clostridia bacterium]|nr:flavodoxin family protein [Clostridia bacterium]
MKTAIVSYSFTGRNDRVAEIISEKLQIEHIKITEKKQRTIMTAAWDVMLGRKPKVAPSPDVIDQYDLVIFMSPVWMGTAASPLHRYLIRVKKTKKDYAYIALSGGGTEKNPTLKKNVMQWAKHEPKAFLDMHVSDLFSDKEISNDEIQRYQMAEEEYLVFADRAITEIEKIL